MSADSTSPARGRRERRTVENRDFDAFARRIVRAYARRVADGDIEALPALQDLASTVDTALRDAVQGLHDFGYSWAEIAGRLGVSRQAVQTRWGQRANTNDPGPCEGVVGDGLGVAVPGWDEGVSLDESRRPAAAAPTPSSGGVAAERTVSARSVFSVQPLFDLSQEGVRS